jgi:hypothetical protein
MARNNLYLIAGHGEDDYGFLPAALKESGSRAGRCLHRHGQRRKPAVHGAHGQGLKAAARASCALHPCSARAATRQSGRYSDGKRRDFHLRR